MVYLVAPPAPTHVMVTVLLPTLATRLVGAGGAVVTVPAGMTNRVTLCAGTVVVIALLATAMLPRLATDVCVAELI